MRFILLLTLLIISGISFSQNPYIHTYSIVNNNKDTTVYTLTVTGSSGFWSTKVSQRATLTNVVRPYRPPVTPPANLPPSVLVSGLTEVTLPTNEVSLRATATDPDGTVSNIAWS